MKHALSSGRAWGSVLGCFGLLGLACGPSFQVVYEGNVRFEHCYALEENAQAPMGQKGECWRDWSEHYTYGQTRDRIQYAIARYVALSGSTAMPTDEAMMAAAPGVTPRQTTINAPAPTNAFAPPPKVLEEDGGGGVLLPPRPSEKNRTLGDPDAGPKSVTAPMPAADCENKCAGDFRACESTRSDGGLSTKCEKPYRACMRTCFK